jgi:hypothetical protein
MPGFGALRQIARSTASGEKKLKKMTIHTPEEGKRAETSVEHEHHPPHSSEQFRFAANEKDALAAHLSKHLGLNLPGKAAGEAAESIASKSNAVTE